MELERSHLLTSTSNSLNITLFLYGIGAIVIRFSFRKLFKITLLLYGIGAGNRAGANAPNICNYIIPIWNWSRHLVTSVVATVLITLFLYGIGAIPLLSFLHLGHLNYIIPIWNWSSKNIDKTATASDYIIPIWNWSKSKNSSFSN